MLLELWPFAISGHLMFLLYCAQHKFRNMYANVLKFQIWIPHEKIGDSYFFLIRTISHFRVISLLKSNIEISLARYLKRYLSKSLDIWYTDWD